MNSCQVQPWHIYLSSFIICQWRVRGSHPAVRAYGAPLSTGSPATDFGFRIDDLGFWSDEWQSEIGNQKSSIRSDQGESRTPNAPCGARRSERRVSASSTTWPCAAARAGIEPASPDRGSGILLPIDERAMLSVRRAGVEPAQPVAADLQSVGLTDAQPTHVFKWHRRESNPQSPRFELGRFADLRTVPFHPSVPGGI